MSNRLIPVAAIFIIVSVFIHLGLVGGVYLTDFKPLKMNDNSVEIVIIEPSKTTKKHKQPQQIVEQDTKPINDETPKDAKYLSKHNQQVVKETRAANSGNFTNAAKPGQRVKGSADAPKMKPKKVSKVSGTLPALKDLRPTFSMTPKAPDKAMEAQVGEVSQTSDHLKDLDKGVQTLLSTREFVYYSYYQRIRQKIRQFWEPAIREKVRKVFASGRSIASARDHITRVIIVLNKKGSLVKVQIVGESGIHDLDEAAVDAFRAAEPFPNPPKGIVEQDGTIKIRWDFVLEARVPTTNTDDNIAGNHESTDSRG